MGTADGHVQIVRRLRQAADPDEGARITVTDVDYAADGENIAVSDLSGRVTLLDASTWSTVGSPVQLRGPVTGVTLAPDGRTAFVVTRTRPMLPAANPTFDGWALLDLATGSVIRTGRLPETGWLFDDFSPDGVPVAVGFDSADGCGSSTRAPGDRGCPGAGASGRDLLAGLVPGRVTDPQQRQRGAPWSCGTPPPTRFRTR